MPVTAICVERLGKRYRIRHGHGQNNTLRDALSGSVQAGAKAVRSIFGRNGTISTRDEWFWALRDVGFEVPAGQVVGIVGANGAGKSTLLKVLSRITEPTTGLVAIRGRVGSLIEVGTGFHSELTGRENTYLSGAVLGMRRAEIDRKFDEMVAFAGVERFIDTPLKHYSSGMQLRLGFAVAAHLDTEILIVDEVLAVGDVEFQKKCLSTMSRVANEGRTVLFVSHNGSAVKALCERAIWLKNGQIAGDGPAGTVLSNYLTSSVAILAERVWHSEPEPAVPAGLSRVAVFPAAGGPGDRITTETPFLVHVDYWNHDPKAQVGARLAISNEQQVLLFESSETERGSSAPPRLRPGLWRAQCELPPQFLAPGVYRLEVTLTRNEREMVDEPEALYFTIFDADEQVTGSYRQRAGVIRPSLQWKSGPLTAPSRTQGA